MVTKLLSVIGMTLLLLGCGNSKQTTITVPEETKETKKQETSGMNLIVNSTKAIKPGDPESRIVYLTQQNTEIQKEWDYIYDEIIDFNYEAGYIYKIKVTSVLVEGKPKLKLVEQYAKERDLQYFILHDIWALTSIKGQVIEITDKRPNLEIFLNSMKVTGSGSCNQIFTNIDIYNSNELKFGPIGSTKMMCDQLALEREYIAALESTRFYTVDTSYLILFDETKKELVRFKKVD